jgi:hypothetical protein
MSRDREGAVRLSLKHRHRLALSINHVSNRRHDVIPVSQPSRASVARPSLSIRVIVAGQIQLPTRIRFEGVHRPLRLRLGIHDYVSMGGPHVGRQKRPVTVRADLLYRPQHGITTGRVQNIRSLIHQIALTRCARRVSLDSAMSGNIVVPIHGTRFIAVQMRTIARERNQIRHESLFYTAPSRSRLNRARSRLTRRLLRLGVAVSPRCHCVTLQTYVSAFVWLVK